MTAMTMRYQAALRLSAVLLTGCANTADPCASPAVTGHGASCAGPHQTLEELWHSARDTNAAIALVVTCEEPMMGSPFVGALGTPPAPGVYYGICADEGRCLIEDSLGHVVQSDAIVLRAPTMISYYATEDGSLHPQAGDLGSTGGVQCLTAQQRYPTGRVLVIVGGGEERYVLIHAAQIGADGSVSGEGTADRTPVPLAAFRAEP